MGRKKKEESSSSNDELKYVLTDNYDEILEQIIDKFTVELEDVPLDEMIVLEDISTDNRGKDKPIVYATMGSASKKMKDIYENITNKKIKYILTIISSHCEDLSENQKKVLLFHELLHISDKGKIRDHDLKDYEIIISRFGTRYLDVSHKSIEDILSDDFSWD
jgi:predicted metallopeptidase